MSDVIVPGGGVVQPTTPVTPQPTSDTSLPPGVPPAGNPPKAGDPGYKPELQAPIDTVPPEVVVDEEALNASGNAVLDIALNTFVTLTGCTVADMQRATGNALEYQDVNLIDKTFLRERFGKHADQAYQLAVASIEHAKNEAKAEETKQKQATTKAINAAHTAAGGEEAWKQAVSVFNSSASDNIKAAVKSLMNDGNVQAGTELLLSTVRNGGMLPNVNPQLNGGSAAPSAGGALSADQFKTELAALRKEAGSSSLETGPQAAKFNQLVARRQAGKNAGL